MYLGVLQKMQSLGAFVKYPVQLPSVEELRIGQDWAPGIVNCKILHWYNEAKAIH